MVATLARRTDAVRALVDAGADVDIRDNRLDNVFLYAGAEGLLDILRIANEAGADPALTNRFGGIALIPASERGHVEVVRYLLAESDVDVDHVNRLGWTALLEAIILSDGGPAHQEIVRMLLEAGADPTSRTARASRPLAHARSRGYDAIAALLVAADAADAGSSRAARLARQLEVREAREHRLAADARVLERDRDLLVVAGQLRGHDDPVAPLRVADAVAVAVAPLAGHDRPRRDGPPLARPEPGRTAIPASSQAGIDVGGGIGRPGPSRRPGGPASRTARPPAYASRFAPRSRDGRNGSPAAGAPGPAAPLPVRAAAGPDRRPRAASRARGTRGPGRGRRRGRRRGGAAARPSAPAGSRAGTATGRSSRRRPTSRGARRGTGTGAASPG